MTPPPIKCLTVREPWASAIAFEFKPVENRSQGFPKGYRGRLGIHTALTWADSGRYDRRILAAWPRDGGAPWNRTHSYALRHVPAYRNRPPEPFVAGCVIALVDVVDIHTANGCCAPWGEETYTPANSEQRAPGKVTHLVLDNVFRLPRPLPARGALGLWTPDEDLALELHEVEQWG